MIENNKFNNQDYYDGCTVNNNHSDLKNTLSDIGSQSHVLIVYSNLSDLREIYTSFAKYALDNNEVVIILYHYDNPSNIAYFLKDRGVDITRYEKEHSLLILDSLEPRFFQYKEDVFDFVKRISEKAKQRGKNGISIISDMGSFFYKGDSQQNKDILFAFENAIPKQFDENIKRLCLYHKDNLNRINDKEKDLLYKSHLSCSVFMEQQEIGKNKERKN